MNTFQMYDAQAGSIRVEDIAKISSNQLLIRHLMRNTYWKNILNIRNNVYEDNDYSPEGTKDMGWLGYFIGKSNHLEELLISSFEPTFGESFMEVLESFLQGVNRNKSIQKLRLDNADELGSKTFTILRSFFENNSNLASLDISECDLEDDESRALALAIGSSKHKSLTHVSFMGAHISDNGMVDIITALSMHPHLVDLDLDGNRLSKNGCVALRTLLQCSATELQHLDLSTSGIDDEGIDILVPALKSCSHLQTLRMSINSSITSRGWQHFATVLASPDSKLRKLNVSLNNIDDQVLVAFADDLTNNTTLVDMILNNNESATSKGWEALSKLLCDTSSVNSTFQSNHTLQKVQGLPNADRPLLLLNKKYDKKEVAMIKIVQHHDDFDMMPFFEWEFIVLPLMITWFEKAAAISTPDNCQPNIGPRKLSSIYQFVRGMPLLYVESRLRKELEDIQVELSMEGQSSQQKQSNEERKRSILERLGRNV